MNQFLFQAASPCRGVVAGQGRCPSAALLPVALAARASNYLKIQGFHHRLKTLALFGAALLLLAGGAVHAHDGEHGAHGDHDPHHGGVVLMFGLDLHYEVVMKPSGEIELWLSNAARADLPATVVSDVAAEVETTGARQNIDMTINDSGDGWVGKASAVQPGDTTLHLGFVYQGEAASVSFPASSLMGEGREQLVKDTAHGAPAAPDDHAGHDGHAMPDGHHGHPAPGNDSI